ncbi:RNA cytidine acetyltransferase like protein [Argiope bruennichi]|uniref:RNA cytidine acetyltransferase like protein n=1 Tax=Argiope bruennichi TaxID=94029 RepID=A0A8T0DXV8_ARGBR|nr:RNA cytidine acetyltransferase like protein [Argiope bruennichi]
MSFDTNTVDKSIKKIIKTSTRSRHRALFVILGSDGSKKVPIFYHLLKQNKVKEISTLWCTKENSNFDKNSSLPKLSDTDDDGFAPYYCSYSNIENISQHSFNLVILQDIEALTLHSLSVALNIAKGSGIIVFLFHGLKNLNDLKTLNLNTGYKLSRFSKRFAVSLQSCPNSMILDDNLNILSSGPKLPESQEFDKYFNKEKIEELKMKYEKDTIITSLLSICVTIEQAELLLKFLETLKNRTFRNILSVSSAVGRGKSAVLGLAIAGSLAFNYSNIFISAMCYKNVSTVFKFLLKGLDVLNYKEDDDFDLIQSINPKLNYALTGINVFRDHPQSVRFIFPEDIGERLEQAELVVFDEAASIPLHILKNLYGPYVVLMAASTSGPEASSPYLYNSMINAIEPSGALESQSGKLQKFTLDDPIHYASGDSIESWLNHLLCVEPAICSHLSCGFPVPDQCRLFCVNRNSLFGGNKQAEEFLQSLMSILTSCSKVINPDHLLNLADSPNYQIFCLLPPVTSTKQVLSGIICALLVHLENEIPDHIVHCGTNLNGSVSNCFNDWKAENKTTSRFLPIKGAHVLNIVTHQNYRKMGYGMRALQLLQEFYEGKCISLDENLESRCKLTDNLEDNPTELPILQQLTEIQPDNVEYILVSCNLSLEFLRFWKKSNFIPVYITDKKNPEGEHSLFMIKAVEETFRQRLEKYWSSFLNQYCFLLGSEFQTSKSVLALSIIQCGSNFVKKDFKELTKAEIDLLIRPHQMRQLEKYCQNLQDFYAVIQLIPTLTNLYFNNCLKGVNLPRTQEAILLSFGYQYKTADDVKNDLGLDTSQIHGLLNRTIKRITSNLTEIIEKSVANTFEKREVIMEPVAQSLDEELEEAAKQIQEKQEQDALKLKDIDISQYAIKGSEDEWEKVLFSGRKALVSIKSIKKIANTIEKPKHNEDSFKKPKHQKKRKR